MRPVGGGGTTAIVARASRAISGTGAPPPRARGAVAFLANRPALAPFASSASLAGEGRRWGGSDSDGRDGRGGDRRRPRRVGPRRSYAGTPALSKRIPKRMLREEEARWNESLDGLGTKSGRISKLQRRVRILSEGGEPLPEEPPPPQKKKKKIRNKDAFSAPKRPKHGADGGASDSGEGPPRPRRKNHEAKRPKPKRTGRGSATLPKSTAQSKPLRPPFSVFASCLPGLEPLLLREVLYLQSRWHPPPPATPDEAKRGIARAVPGGVALAVPTAAHLHVLHLYLGTASHVYLRLNDDHFDGVPSLFAARGFPELKRKLGGLMASQRWDRMLDVGGGGAKRTLRVDVSASKSKLMHTKAVEERVRDTLREVAGLDFADGSGAEGADGDRPAARLLVRIERDAVQLSLDTSGSPLHRRGYKVDPHKAPLREDLAFAALMAGGLKPEWDLEPLRPLLADDDGGASPSDDDAVRTDALAGASPAFPRLFDPCCGSGTIAIEGCAILAGLPPGRLRPAPLRGTTLCDPGLWERMKAAATSASIAADEGRGREKSVDGILVAANDLDPKAVRAAKANAKIAGVERFVDFKVGPFRDHPLLDPSSGKAASAAPPSQPLLVVANPPYGKRLPTGDASGAGFYKKLARSLFASPHDIACALIGKDIRSMRESSLPLEVAFSTKHGGLSVVAMAGGKAFS
ncbi:hypothetical protein ACHAWF_002960 [Thalassiosira exigua]